MQVCTSFQTDNHASTPPLSVFTGRMPFLPPNQQRQSTEGNSTQTQYRKIVNSRTVFENDVTGWDIATWPFFMKFSTGSSFGGIAIRYVLPCFVDDDMFAHIGQKRRREDGVYSK